MNKLFLMWDYWGLTKEVIENESFWKTHNEHLKLSELTRADYCRKHNLNYDRFGYWISKWNRFKREETNSLVSIKLKSTPSPSVQTILYTLESRNGNILKIHDMGAFSIILEKYL